MNAKMCFIRFRIIQFLLPALLLSLSGCKERGDTEPTPVTIASEEPDSFLIVPDYQVGLAAGKYSLVATAPAAVADSYRIDVTFDDGTQQTLTGSWVSAGGTDDPNAAGNMAHEFVMKKPGGIRAELTSNTEVAPKLFIVRNAFVVAKQTSSADKKSVIELANNQINSEAYATAYYNKVDPNNERTTLADWKRKNGFDAGEHVHVVFRDAKDLGYGRNMHARRNADGSFAIFVENYIVALTPGDPRNYGPINVEAAIREDRRFHVGTNAIEFSPIDQDNPTSPKVLKFFTFKPESSDPNATQNRLLKANLDGRGEKFVPGTCLTCHGARMLPLNADGSFPEFTLLTSKHNQIEAELVEYANADGWRRADMEPGIKMLNEYVTESYNGQKAYEDTVAGKWHADFSIALAEGRYGGEGMPDNTFNSAYVPAGWQQTPNRPEGVELLYKRIIEPHCVSCHALQGNEVGEKIKVAVNGENISLANAVNFSSYEKFIAYESRIIDYVFKRGLMPLGLRNYENFWLNADDKPALLASFLPSFDLYVNGKVQTPGRPVARAGADRVVVSPVQLDASASNFATTYRWQITSTPTGAVASLDNTAIAAPTLTADTNGDYVLSLTVSNNRGESSDDIVVTVDNTATDQRTLTFVDDIRPILGSATDVQCSSCHRVTSGTFNELLRQFPGIPVIYQDSNANLYRDVLARVNFADPENSRLLRKPTSLLHGGGLQLDLNDEVERAKYITILNWIREGAPCGNHPTLCQ